PLTWSIARPPSENFRRRIAHPVVNGIVRKESVDLRMMWPRFEVNHKRDPLVLWEGPTVVVRDPELRSAGSVHNAGVRIRSAHLLSLFPADIRLGFRQ